MLQAMTGPDGYRQLVTRLDQVKVHTSACQGVLVGPFDKPLSHIAILFGHGKDILRMWIANMDLGNRTDQYNRRATIKIGSCKGVFQAAAPTASDDDGGGGRPVVWRVSFFGERAGHALRGDDGRA